jgi:hypothetical protein
MAKTRVSWHLFGYSYHTPIINSAITTDKSMLLTSTIYYGELTAGTAILKMDISSINGAILDYIYTSKLAKYMPADGTGTGTGTGTSGGGYIYKITGLYADTTAGVYYAGLIVIFHRQTALYRKWWKTYKMATRRQYVHITLVDITIGTHVDHTAYTSDSGAIWELGAAISMYITDIIDCIGVILPAIEIIRCPRGTNMAALFQRHRNGGAADGKPGKSSNKCESRRDHGHDREADQEPEQGREDAD